MQSSTSTESQGEEVSLQGGFKSGYGRGNFDIEGQAIPEPRGSHRESSVTSGLEAGSGHLQQQLVSRP